MTTHRTIIIVVILAVGIAIGLFLVGVFDTPRTVDTAAWETYESEEFTFSISVPPGWRVHEFYEDEVAPGVNIYPETVSAEPPFIHHSDVPNVSIFPHGIPTEGVFGETVDTRVRFLETPQNAHDFILADGTRWATFATFAAPPDSWREWGFVWARVSSDRMQTVCMREGTPVREAECDLFRGDEIVHRGTISAEERMIQRVMLESFRFVE